MAGILDKEAQRAALKRQQAACVASGDIEGAAKAAAAIGALEHGEERPARKQAASRLKGADKQSR